MINLLTTKGNFATPSAMTGQWRIECEGAYYYHILLRGNERRDIFNNNQESGGMGSNVANMIEKSWKLFLERQRH